MWLQYNIKTCSKCILTLLHCGGVQYILALHTIYLEGDAYNIMAFYFITNKITVKTLSV